MNISLQNYDILVFIFCSFYMATTYGLDNYGPYELKWVKFNMCKGSKPPCGTTVITNLQNASDIIYTMTMHRDCVIGKISLAMSIATEINGKNSSTEYLKYSVDKPCQHFIAGPIIRQTYGRKAFDKCIIPKGKHVNHFDIQGLTRTFLGSKFFYGTFSFKTVINNKKYHISCHESVMVSAKI